MSTGRVHAAVEVPTSGTRDEQIHAITQDIARAFEAGIRDHSSDWHMMQPVWIADLDPARRRSG